jgi:type 1 glutamine amidotransferase
MIATSASHLSIRSLAPWHLTTALAFATVLLSAPTTPAQTPTKVLFWGGPATSSHNVPAFRDTIVPYLTGQNMTVTYRQNTPYAFLHTDSLAQYDVMLVYTTNQDASQLTQGQLTALTTWIASGRVMVAVHGTTNTFITNNASITSAWRALTGAQFADHGPAAGSGNSGTITYTTTGTTHGSLAGTIALPTSGVNTGDHPYWDEGRRHTANLFSNDTLVLARALYTTPSATSLPWIWVRPQGNGWVYYNASGHDGQVWTRLEFKTQILRALQWGQAVSTGIRGEAALPAVIRTEGHHIIVPLRTGYSFEVTTLQGRGVYKLARTHAARHDLGFLSTGTYGVRVQAEQRESYQTLFIKRP